MSIVAIVTVATDADPEDLHEDDGSVAGVYGVVMGTGVGEYPLKPRMDPAPGEDSLHEAALDAFHDHVAISDLEPFDISVGLIASPDDAPEDVRWL